MPLPKMTPMRDLASVDNVLGSMPASWSASSAATMAYWQNGSSRLASLRSRNSSGSKPLTSHANRVSNADASNRVIEVAPLSPRRAADQNSPTVFPIGVSAPIPVTTTRCFIEGNVEASRVVRDPRSVRHGVRAPDMRLSYDMPSLHIPFFQVLSRC